MRVVCSCVALAVCVALLNASWAGQDKGKQDKKQKVLDVGKGLDLKGTLDNELGIEYNAPKAKKGSKVKKAYQAFDVKFVKGKTYQIDMIVDEGVVAYLFLEDSKKNVVDENLSGGDDPICARITFKAPEDGVYRIIATTFMGFGQGDFQLKVAEKAGQDKEKPKQDKQPKVLDVGKGLEINSKLNKDADGPYAAPDAVDGDKNKKQHKLFLVNFVKGKTYQIDMIRGECEDGSLSVP